MNRMKQQLANKTKSLIILNVLDYIEHDNIVHKRLAIDELKKLAKFYNVFLKKSRKIDVNIALREFILNDKGYNRTIVNLYNTLS